MRRVKIGKEPILKVHRYVVEVCFVKAQGCHKKLYYCANLKEVRELRNVHRIRRQKKQANAADFILVHRASHNFIQAWDNGPRK